MTTTRAPGRSAAVALSLLAVGLLVVHAVRHAQALAQVGGFGLPPRDVVVFAVLTALLAATAAVLARAQRVALPPRALPVLAAGNAVLLLLFPLAGDPDDVGLPHDGGFTGAYGSTLLLDFSPELPWLSGAVTVGLLGLLPVAAVAAARRADGTAAPGRLRTPLLVTAALAAVLLLVLLESSVALLDLLRGDPQELGGAQAVTWVAALWALVALAWCTRALRSASTGRLSLALPPVLLLAGALLLVDGGGRHTCCYGYSSSTADVVVGAGGREPGYLPPPLLPDVLLLGGCLLVGVALPLAGQRLRVRTSASTPPG